MTWRLALWFAIASGACAQSLVDPGRSGEIRQVFDRTFGASTLRCNVSPVRPALTFGFRFQTGYRLGVPLAQFSGPGHQLRIYLRVLPEGRTPVYLTTATTSLPELADAKVEATADGMFVVGEGVYQVAIVVLDDQQRACRSAWKVEAVRTGNERHLAPTTPPGTVAELDPGDPAMSPAAHSRDIAKLTIFLHAAPFSPSRPKLLPDDVALLTESIGSLLRQWPARSVRLIAFNLDQRSVVWRNDQFDAGQIAELTSHLEQLDLGAVNYRVLQGGARPMDLLTGLIGQELRHPQPADAILLVGPPARSRDDGLSQVSEKASRPIPVFYLQFLQRQTFIGRPPGWSTSRARTMGDAQSLSPERLGDGLPATPPMALNVAQADSIQRLVGRLKGDTVAIRTPHDLADAIHHIDPHIARSAPPVEPAHATIEAKTAKITVPALPPADTPPALESRTTRNEDPIDVLALLRDRVLENGQSMPNHTCVETVERSHYNHIGEPVKSCDTILASRRQPGASARLRLATSDRLRLDVALSTEREIYSWAGANRFEEGDIDEIVPNGAMGTGPFASFLLSVFIGRPPRFTFEGETVIKGQSLYEYSFEVPRDESHFRFKAHKEWMITGYSGTLFVDPQTSDLARLVVRTEELPPETETCEVDTTLDYGKVRLISGTFFLPSSTTQRFIGRDGEEFDNVYTFSTCRDFHAESSVDFGGHSSEPSIRADRSARPSSWPPGLPVVIEMTDAIDSATAAAGDPVHGRIAQAIRDQQGRTLAPQGASVAGRLMRVEVRYPSPQVTIVIRWETLDPGGQTVPLQLAPNHAIKRESGIQLGGIAAIANLRRRGVEFELPLPGEERYGIYHFPGKHYVVESGLRTEWVTVKP